MCLRVHTRLVRGCPCVELRDDATGDVCYRWNTSTPAADIDGHAVQDLIRILLLASAQPPEPDAQRDRS